MVSFYFVIRFLGGGEEKRPVKTNGNEEPKKKQKRKIIGISIETRFPVIEKWRRPLNSFGDKKRVKPIRT